MQVFHSNNQIDTFGDGLMGGYGLVWWGDLVRQMIQYIT